MTQADEIEQMLSGAGAYGVCATVFLANYMPTYSQRIGELKRRRGLTITTKRCDHPGHNHNHNQLVYVLENNQLRLEI
jgi:hypothetical protein